MGATTRDLLDPRDAIVKVATIITAVVFVAGCSKGADPLADVHIGVNSDGNRFWTLVIRNTSEQSVSIDWDASSYVGGDGRSLGRLVRGETRKMDLGNPQPATPVAPGASIEQSVIPEEYARDLESSAGPDEKGTMFVVVDIGGKKHTWKGAPKAAPPPEFPWWCDSLGVCYRTRQACKTASNDRDECPGRKEPVSCFMSKRAGKPADPYCYIDEGTCRTWRSSLVAKVGDDAATSCAATP